MSYTDVLRLLNERVKTLPPPGSSASDIFHGCRAVLKRKKLANDTNLGLELGLRLGSELVLKLRIILTRFTFK